MTYKTFSYVLLLLFSSNQSVGVVRLDNEARIGDYVGVLLLIIDSSHSILISSICDIIVLRNEMSIRRRSMSIAVHSTRYIQLRICLLYSRHLVCLFINIRSDDCTIYDAHKV